RRILAENLFEKDFDGNDQPKRGLVFGILTENGIEDTLFDVKHTPTDDIKENYFPTEISVPRGEGSIIPGQKRGVFIKHKDEVIVNGKCPKGSHTCAVKLNAVTIMKR